jgi:malyl-CoA/(S)-citramalyl-CoA lyase
MTVKTPRQFFRPLAIGAPEPFRELPLKLERMIHFVPPHLEKVRAKVGELAGQVDIVLGNLEDAIPVEAKQAARDGFIAMGKAVDFGKTGLWTRVNALNSPWFLADITAIMAEIGGKLDVVMVPKVEGPWDIHYVDQLLAQFEARHSLPKPILIHAILETAEGVKNVDTIAGRLPAHAGDEPGAGRSRRLARDEDDARRRRPPGIQGHRGSHADGAARAVAQQDLWHYTLAKMVDACAAAGIKPFYGPFGDSPTIRRLRGAVPQRLPAGLRRRLDIASLADRNRQARLQPGPHEVAFAKRILEAMPDGSGAVMIDGKMQDDATWKQAKVIVDLAKQVAGRDPAFAEHYGL